MKKFILLSLFSAAITTASFAQAAQAGVSDPVEPSIVKKGEKLRLQTVVKLTDDPSEVIVIGFGPKAWVLVEYEVTLARRNAEGAAEQAREKVQIWVNFDHVISAKQIPPVPAK